MKYFLLAIMIILAALPVGDVRAETVLYEEDMIGPLESPPPPPEIEVEEFPGASLHENPPGDRGPASGPVIQARRQPRGALSGVLVFTSPGHGWVATSSGGWYTARPFLNGMVEDYGNIDQINFFVNYCFNAGATVIPMRPVGFQTNEVVMDNTSPGVTWSGPWENSVATSNYYGRTGDLPYRFVAISAEETAVARYTPNIPQTGYYPVYTWILPSANRVNQLYRIVTCGMASEVRVNHRRVGQGWVWLGNYYFEAGTGGYVEISNQSDESSGYAVADAIRFGNGMGNINRGAGVSSQPRELEASRYWVQNTIDNEVGGDKSRYDLDGYSDNDDNVGTPPRMAAYMNRSEEGTFWERIYIGFHTNCCSKRGAMGLYNSVDAPAGQIDFASAVVNEVNNDMEALDNGIGFPFDWLNNSIDLYSSNYGEIRGASLNHEMCGTIIEVAFHDVA
ncbi:MAG TPA: hypothetical protein PLB62_04425, partial [Candidatus Sumerlaeota bacterium]|nr:hypothetical protein [Candidatus Sumerlaeota bacterium]